MPQLAKQQPNPEERSYCSGIVIIDQIGRSGAHKTGFPQVIHELSPVVSRIWILTHRMPTRRLTPTEPMDSLSSVKDPKGYLI